MRTRIGIPSITRTGVIILFALLITACGSSETIPPGSYTATFTAADNIQVGGSLMTGVSSITFTEAGDFTVHAPQATIVGRYSVDGDQITFDDGTGTFPCEDVPVYVYRWKLDDNMLSFSTVEDSCYLRTLAMTAKTYVLDE